MAGSIPGSGIAEPAAAGGGTGGAAARAGSPIVGARRWTALRRAARVRLAPFGAAVVLVALLVALAAPLLSPYDPLRQNLGNTLAKPGRAHLLGTEHIIAGLVPTLPA